MRKIYSLLIPVSLFFMASPSQLKAQVPGNGLLFDGDDDYVNVYTTTSDELNPIDSLTLECWVYLNEIPSETHFPHLISRFNCYSLTVGTNGLATAYLHNDEEREHIASRGRAYFNEYLTPTANALYIIKKAESMLQKGRP